MATIQEITVPDIGGATKVDVIEILVKPGDHVKVEQSLITLEGEKATMEIPSPAAGVVKKLNIKVGDKVSQGSPILTMEIAVGTEKPATKAEISAASTTTASQAAPAPVRTSAAATQPTIHAAPTAAQGAPVSAVNKTTAGVTLTAPPVSSSDTIYASPTVRRIARMFGIDLYQVPGSGTKGRILPEDVEVFVKAELQKTKGAPAIGGIAPMPVIDFSKFGEIETKPLNKIKRLTGVNVHRSWVTVPHVTQFDQADITDLEAFRQSQKNSLEAQGIKLTPLVFIMKAVVAALREFPVFNASLDPSGESLILKKYFHIGVAVDTPNGLVVPVIRDVDRKGVVELAQELAVISKKAREKGLSIAEMSGSCFTISSLGGIGGTTFTPIVNAPDVAILGVSKASMQPVYQNGQFVPRLLLPLALSYDHRVVDGADGARFIVYLASRLADVRTLLL